MTYIFRGLGQMARGLTIAAIVIAVLMLVLFALDLAIGIPFGGVKGGNMMIDIAFLVCGVGMILLGISTWRELE